MPVYAFTCARCGPFELTRPMAQSSSKALCPACGKPARRVFSPPGLALVATPVRGVLDAQESSAHEPAVVADKRGRPLPHSHGAAPPWALGH